MKCEICNIRSFWWSNAIKIDCLNCQLVRFSLKKKKKREMNADWWGFLLFLDDSSSTSQHDEELKTNSCCKSCNRRPTPIPTPWNHLSESEPQMAVAQCGGYTTKGKRRRTSRRKRKRKKVLSNSEKQNLRAVRTGLQPKVVCFLFYCGNQLCTCWLFLTAVINPQCGETAQQQADFYPDNLNWSKSRVVCVFGF